jgi:DNA polymerase-3 subunit delta
VSPAKVVPWRAISVAPVLLVSGPQEFFADRAVKNVRDVLRKKDNLEIVEIEGSEYLEGSIFDLASAGLFGDSKLVIINGVERCSDALIPDGIEYLANPAEDAVVIFKHSGKSVRGKKLLEALRANDNVIEATCLDISKDAEKIAFVESEFNSKGRKIQRAAAVALVEIFGSDFEELSAASSQLQLDDAGEITPQIVEKYFGGRLETNAFKVADSAFLGRTSESILLLRHALDQGAEPVFIITAFTMKLRQMGMILGNPNATPGTMRIEPWKFDKARAACAGWNEESLANGFHLLADTDFAVKGGAKDPHYALEKLVTFFATKGRGQ